MADPLRLSAEYDDIADVMYLTLGRDDPRANAIEDREGFVWRSLPDGRLIGVTIMDYRHQWHSPHRVATLINRIAPRLRVSAFEARKVLENV